MARSTVSGVVGFHEMPLVLFTALGVAGGGIGVTTLIRGALSGALPILSRGEAILLAALLGAGVLISARHLGRPFRGPLAVRGLGRSALSNEIFALGLALGGAALALASSSEGPWRVALSGLAGLASVAFLWFLGAVYNLPGQLAWRGAPAAHPLVMGVAWGLLIALEGWGGSSPPLLAFLFWIVLAVDGILAGYRLASLEWMKRQGEASHPSLFRGRRGLWGARLLLSHLVTPLALALGPWSLAVVSLSAAVLVDRFAFYALGFRVTTESEVARVEALLGGSGQVPGPGS